MGLIAAAVLAVAVLAVSGVAEAQDVQGPPDGFRPAQDARPPAQGPADNGIVPLAPPVVRPQILPQPPAAQRQPPAAQRQPPAVQRQPSAAQRQPVPKQAAAPRPAAAEPPRVGVRPADQAGQRVAVPETPAVESSSGAAEEITAGALPSGELINEQAALPPTAPPISAESADMVADDFSVPAAIGGWPTSWVAAALALLVALGLGGWLIRRRRLLAVLADGGYAEDASPQPADLNAQPAAKPKANAPPPAAPTPVAPPPAVPTPVAVTDGRATLSMTLQVEAIEMLGDAARISFSLLLANSGDRAAESGLVRIALQQANANQTVLLERFFDGAGGSVLADEVVIAPGDVGTIRRNALLPLNGVEPMMIGGYPSLIPVIGFDVTYHWSGDGADGDDDAFGQTAAAFVLGTSAAADGRVAPVRLDLGPRRLNNPVARVTALERVR